MHNRLHQIKWLNIVDTGVVQLALMARQQFQITYFW